MVTDALFDDSAVVQRRYGTMACHEISQPIDRVFYSIAFVDAIGQVYFQFGGRTCLTPGHAREACPREGGERASSRGFLDSRFRGNDGAICQ
jgi:hypothetical protein